MVIDLPVLLALPADQRLALAELLRQSVGCPDDPGALELPAWQQHRLAEALARYAPSADD